MSPLLAILVSRRVSGNPPYTSSVEFVALRALHPRDDLQCSVQMLAQLRLQHTSCLQARAFPCSEVVPDSGRWTFVLAFVLSLS